jgi:hypothetical protein
MTLLAHPNVEYSVEGKLIGQYPALVADVFDIAWLLVTLHVTGLHQGTKLAGYPARKLLSKMTGRVGCAPCA